MKAQLWPSMIRFVTFDGKNKFYNNTSVYGGGINLVGNGFINLEVTAEMSFKK